MSRTVAPPGFLKGQLHLHTDASGDSDTPADVVERWYAERGYDFIVFTDHNVVTDTIDPPNMLTLPGVELTQNFRRCVPAPETGHACLLHLDALFVARGGTVIDFDPPTDRRRTQLFGRAFDRAEKLGGLAQLNHPNFHYAADLEVIMHLVDRGLRLMEVANMAIDSNNEGDADHPSTEALWDAALTRGATLYGTATDDAHHYDDVAETEARGEIAYVGDRGWVMVRSKRDRKAIREAIERGDFYASTGVTFSVVETSTKRIRLEVVSGGSEVDYVVVGAGGRILHRHRGRSLDFDPSPALASARPGERSYVRVRAEGSGGDRAWTQPVFAP